MLQATYQRHALELEREAGAGAPEKRTRRDEPFRATGVCLIVETSRSVSFVVLALFCAVHAGCAHADPDPVPLPGSQDLEDGGSQSFDWGTATPPSASASASPARQGEGGAQPGVSGGGGGSGGGS